MSAPRPIAPAPPFQARPTPIAPATSIQPAPAPVRPAQHVSHHVPQQQHLAPAPPQASTSAAQAPAPTEPADGEPKPKKQRRNKVAEACRFCRRSHMSCDAGRPCGRCIKRDIAHLCRDEPLPTTSSSAPGIAPAPAPAPQNPAAASSSSPVVEMKQITPGSAPQQKLPDPLPTPTPQQQMQQLLPPLDLGSTSNLFGGPLGTVTSAYSAPSNPSAMQASYNFSMLDMGSNAAPTSGLPVSLGLDDFLTDTKGQDGDFYGLGLSDFLRSLQDPAANSFLDQFNLGGTTGSTPSNGLNLTGLPPGLGLGTGLTPTPMTTLPEDTTALFTNDPQAGAPLQNVRSTTTSRGPSAPSSPLDKTDRFFLTAADQKDGSRSDRLARVIHAKFEAGLLRPYNHVAGYTRLMRWMADHMSASSRQRTLKTLSEFRPAFRSIASGLTDLDLVFIEEAFERLLLDYDRVFSSMGIPSCLWRRTGEIYKGNQEFADLVGVPIDQLKEGKLAIYELMAEESAVNYWEKYGNIAFDAGQKAVLTSCVLVNQRSVARNKKRAKAGRQRKEEDPNINCCFSFTVRRDNYAIPSMIVGNFLKF